jgi:Alpha/beta hydrolase domain
VTNAAREQAHDPRTSIEERYDSRAQYGRLVTDAATKLVEQRYLLTEDAPLVVERTLAIWDEVTRGTALAGK